MGQYTIYTMTRQPLAPSNDLTHNTRRNFLYYNANEISFLCLQKMTSLIILEAMLVYFWYKIIYFKLPSWKYDITPTMTVKNIPKLKDIFIYLFTYS